MRPEAGPGLQPVYRSSPELASGPRAAAAARNRRRASDGVVYGFLCS